jgi:Flp pilus assembly protein TadG
METMSRKTDGPKRCGERGATVVEFAVIVVLLLLLVFGILEFAFIFFQRHFVENAAREGMRLGIRYDNFNCFDGLPATGCTQSLDRKHVVEQKVTDYLSALYQPEDILVTRAERVLADKSLKVTVQVKNFFPQLLTGLIPGFANSATITYSTTGVYEDPDEFDSEK